MYIKSTKNKSFMTETAVIGLTPPSISTITPFVALPGL